MKIVSVEAIPLEAPIQNPVGRARQRVVVNARRCLLVKITTDEGLVGYGEGLTPLTPMPAKAVVDDIFKDILLGQDPMNTEYLWNACYETNSSRGYTRGYQMIAISAVDIALWDLKGKITGQPVYNLLGGKFRDTVPGYVTGLMLEKDPSGIADLAMAFRERGFKAMKLKIGENERQDLATVEVLRETLGPDARLMVDANGGHDPKSAVKLAEKLKPFDIFWFEEPVPQENMAGLAYVRERIPMYLAGGECEYNKYEFRNLFLNGALDICQPDVSRSGGITETMKIVKLAQAFNVYYAPHAWGGIMCVAASCHMAAAMPNCLTCEIDQVPNPLRDELAGRRIDFRDGVVHLSDKPGLGFEPQAEMIERFRIDK